VKKPGRNSDRRQLNFLLPIEGALLSVKENEIPNRSDLEHSRQRLMRDLEMSGLLRK